MHPEILLNPGFPRISLAFGRKILFVPDSRQPNLRDLIESGPWLCYISLIASSFKLLVARWIFFWDLRNHFFASTLLNCLASIFSSPPLPWTMIHSTLYCIGSSVQYVLIFLVLRSHTNWFADSRRCLVQTLRGEHRCRRLSKSRTWVFQSLPIRESLFGTVRSCRTRS